MQRREFDTIRFPRHPPCRPAREDDIPRAAEFVERALPEFKLGDRSVIAGLVRFDPDMIQLFFRKGEVIGLYAMLFLNRHGLDALLEGGLCPQAPALEHLARPQEAPCGIYNWLVVLPGPASAGFGTISELLSRERYADADLYARPLTAEGLRIMVGIGYRPLAGRSDKLHCYARLRNRGEIRRVAA